MRDMITCHGPQAAKGNRIENPSSPTPAKQKALTTRFVDPKTRTERNPTAPTTRSCVCIRRHHRRTISTAAKPADGAARSYRKDASIRVEVDGAPS